MLGLTVKIQCYVAMRGIKNTNAADPSLRAVATIEDAGLCVLYVFSVLFLGIVALKEDFMYNYRQIKQNGFFF